MCYMSCLSPLLTHVLAQCSIVLLEKLTGSQLVKKFLAFYETRTFILFYLLLVFDEKYKLYSS